MAIGALDTSAVQRQSEAGRAVSALGGRQLQTEGQGRTLVPRPSRRPDVRQNPGTICDYVKNTMIYHSAGLFYCIHLFLKLPCSFFFCLGYLFIYLFNNKSKRAHRPLTLQ